MYFYELHEGDDELYSDALLAHDVEFDEEQFLEMVLEARASVLTTFEEDTLSLAIANELERRYQFLHIDDTRLRVSVLVSAEEGETTTTTVEERRAGPDGEDLLGDEDYRSLLVEIDPEDDPRIH